MPRSAGGLGGGLPWSICPQRRRSLRVCWIATSESRTVLAENRDRAG
ncbi:MAG: hypothetical protein HC824_21130 [Synechococcales cyanobacterium RM1_1_8]|nr:hypothetical protein [Synechococcales cyanobacterium RM1_1_8]